MADIVVDIGNSRIKWGRVVNEEIATDVSLPHDDPTAWETQLRSWRMTAPLRWMLAGVRPSSQAMLLNWIKARGDSARCLNRAADVPLEVRLPEPDMVGIDRLLAAVGANARRGSSEAGAIIVGVGTAITVDLLAPEGAFLGGAIFPGPRLMALALHQHTALLPLVEPIPPQPETPATSTRAAIELGIHAALVGGVNDLIQRMSARLTSPPESIAVFVTGGGAALIAPRLRGKVHLCPTLVLEGILRTAHLRS